MRSPYNRGYNRGYNAQHINCTHAGCRGIQANARQGHSPVSKLWTPYFLRVAWLVCCAFIIYVLTERRRYDFQYNKLRKNIGYGVEVAVLLSLSRSSPPSSVTGSVKTHKSSTVLKDPLRILTPPVGHPEALWSVEDWISLVRGV